MKKILLLVNPYSGDGKNLENKAYIEQFLQKKGWTVMSVLSESIGYFTDYLQKNDLEKFDVIGVVGGDGTMHEVVNAVVNQIHVPPILLFPCGTGNSFTEDLGITSLDIALQRLEKMQVRAIDCCEITFPDHRSCYSFNILGWGLVAAINVTAENIRFLGGARYTVAALYHIFKNSKYTARLQINDEIIEGDFSFILACNTVHTGKAMKIAPLASLYDGLLDVLIVPHLSVWQLLTIFPKIYKGKHIPSTLFRYEKSNNLSISNSNLPLLIDGENKCHAPYAAKILAKKIKIIV